MTTTAKWKTTTVRIDCPRSPECGGGIEGSDGSFVLDVVNIPEGVVGRDRYYTCGECGTRFKVPQAPFKALGVIR